MINSLTSRPSNHPSAVGSSSLSKPSQTSQTQQKFSATAATPLCSLSSFLAQKHRQVCRFDSIEGLVLWGCCSFWVLEFCCVFYIKNGQLRERPWKVNRTWKDEVKMGGLEKMALFMDVCERGEVGGLCLTSPHHAIRRQTNHCHWLLVQQKNIFQGKASTPLYLNIFGSHIQVWIRVCCFEGRTVCDPLYSFHILLFPRNLNFQQLLCH